MRFSERIFLLTRNCAIWLLMVTVSCDTLEKDEFDDHSRVVYDGELIVLSSQNSGIIDLNSLIHSSRGDHTFSITTQPHLGTLQPIEEFLIRYTPNENVIEG